jgi:hypothetical protein
LAAVFAVFLGALVAARPDAPFFARLFAVFFADRLTAFLAAFFAVFFAARFTTLLDARLAPFAVFALVFDAFDLAIGKPLRPLTAAEDPPAATGRRACLDRLS